MNILLTLLLAGQLSSFQIQPVNSPQYAGDSFFVTIIALDSIGNVYNYNRVAYLATTRGAYIYPNVIGPFTNGIWQGQVIVTLAEWLKITCTDDSGRVTDSSDIFQVLSGPPAQFLLLLPGEEFNPGTREGKIGEPSIHIAGNSFDFQVYLTDEWCNPVRHRIDSVYFKATDSFATLPFGGVIDDGWGVFSAVFREAKDHRIFALPAHDESFRGDTSALFLVNPGVFDRLILLLPGEDLVPGDTTMALVSGPGKTGAVLPQFVQEPFLVKVFPCDRCWNRVNNAGVIVSLFSDFPVEFDPDETTLEDSAVFTAEFKFAGDNQNIWVADEDEEFVSYRSFLNIKPLGKRLEITAPDSVFAGETATVRVVVFDANEMPISGTVCRFTLFKGSGEILKEAVLTDTAGVAVTNFLCTRAKFAEFDSIRISSGAVESLIGIYVKIPDKELMVGEIIAFPNPFGFNRDGCEIYYYLNKSTPVDFRIYDPFGNEVVSWRFRAGEPGGKAGINQVVWNGRNKEGRRVASGVYLVQLIGEFHTARESKKSYRLGVVW